MLVFSLVFSEAETSVRLLVIVLEPSVVVSSSGVGVLVADVTRCTLFKASMSWESENWSNGSRLERIVPAKRTGS